MSSQPFSPERRVAARVAVERAVTVVVAGDERTARTINVSTSGMLVALDDALTIWAEVVVALPGVGMRSARVARCDGAHYGLVFREPLSPDEFAEITGVAVPPVEPEPVAPVKRPARTAPWAFGRDRLKTLKREAAERARLG